MEDPQLLEKLSVAIRNQNFHNFKHLTKNASRKWCRKTNRSGHTVLQEAIRRNSKEIFDYILQFQDWLDLETVNVSGQTALMFLLSSAEWNQFREYYACELIKKDAFIHTICTNDQGDSFLHQAVKKNSMEVMKLLLEKGIDVNVQDNDGWTALRMVLSKGPHTAAYEFVAALLYYGADPFIECFDDYKNAFESSILYNKIFSIQEILFWYTFDKKTRCKIHFGAFLQLAIDKSPFFHQVFEYDVEFVSVEYFGDFCNLFVIDIDYLRILLKNCNSVIIEIITKINNDLQYSEKRFRMSQDLEEYINSNQFLTNLNFLLEYNKTMKTHIVNFLANLYTSAVFDTDFFCSRNESDATEILMYMFSYGFQCGSDICDLVYLVYGYCQLFKFLLFLDVDKNIDTMHHPTGIAALVYDINLDLGTFLKDPTRCVIAADELLDYFAHPKLLDLLINDAKEWNVPDRVEQFEKHSRMPLLVELSRNAFRKYFVQRLNIKSCRDFYSRINDLQISSVYKKFITFETKLY